MKLKNRKPDLLIQFGSKHIIDGTLNARMQKSPLSESSLLNSHCKII